MAQLTDISVGTKDESVYGTGVVVDRFDEPKGLKFSYDKGVKQGEGLRVGSSIARAARRVVTTKSYGVEFELDALSKGQGLWWKRCMGTSTSTVVTGATYQQLFKLGTSADVVPIFTTQGCAVRADGTVDPYTFAGCVVESWDFNLGQGDIASLKLKIDARSMSTATAYATPSYVTSPTIFSFEDASITLVTGGTVTAPTTMALGSITGGTAITSITDFSLSADFKRDLKRFLFGAAGLKAVPTPGPPEVKGKVTIQYTDRAAVDAFLADTSAQLLLTIDTGVALSTGNETLQILLSSIKLEGDLPEPEGELVSVDLDFTVMDDGTNPPVCVVLRTADTAL